MYIMFIPQSFLCFSKNFSRCAVHHSDAYARETASCGQRCTNEHSLLKYVFRAWPLTWRLAHWDAIKTIPHSHQCSWPSVWCTKARKPLEVLTQRQSAKVLKSPHTQKLYECGCVLVDTPQLTVRTLTHIHTQPHISKYLGKHTHAHT